MAQLAGLDLESRWADWDRSPVTSSSPSHVSVCQDILTDVLRQVTLTLMDGYAEALGTIDQHISGLMTQRPLEALSSAAALRQHADDLLQRAVASAVGTHSWTEIGSALGVSKQAAHGKYVKSVAASLVEQRRAEKRARKVGDTQARETAKATQAATAEHLRSLPRP